MSVVRHGAGRGGRARLCSLLVLALAACSTAPRDPAEAPWTTGRLNLRVAATAERGASSETAAFELRGDAERGELRLNSPLGTRVATARWVAGQAVLATADGEQRFDTLDALSREALGQPLPLAALPDWLAGRPWPLATHEPRDDGFAQLGWTIHLARRDLGFIEAQRAAPPALWLRIKLDLPDPP